MNGIKENNFIKKVEKLCEAEILDKVHIEIIKMLYNLRCRLVHDLRPNMKKLENFIDINLKIMSDKALALWDNIGKQQQRWHYTRMVSLIVPPQPAIITCECQRVLHIQNTILSDITCPNCGAYYTMDFAQSLPRAEEELS